MMYVDSELGRPVPGSQIVGKMRKFRARENGGRAGKSFFPFFFLVRTFSIQRARLSQSLEKAKLGNASN